MMTRLHCQVLEVPAQDDWLPRRSDCPRELLPWADPYIARLIYRLELQYSVDGAEADVADPFVADDAPWTLPEETAEDDFGDWEDDAFLPPPHGMHRFHWYPPVYGGFPLLDDVAESDEAA